MKLQDRNFVDLF